jgi:predicted permease
MSVGIPVHDGAYPTWAARSGYFEQLLRRARNVPGVTTAAISTNATPPSNGWNTAIDIMGKPPKDDQKVRVNFVSQGYFPILRIPLAQGRLWDEAENHHAARVAVINETMARRYFPDGAIGHSLRIPAMKNEPPFMLTAAGDRPWLQIIGVIADKRNDGLRAPILPETFVPYTLSVGVWTQILVRSQTSPLGLLHAIGKQVNSVDAEQQISGHVQDLEHWIQGQPEWEQGHLTTWLFSAFAILALALAATGLYSVVSFSVAQRTNEFGIRMTLGAQPKDVLRVVFASAVVNVGTGLIVGVILTLGLSNVLAKWAEGSSRDIPILLGTTMLLTFVAALARAVPAHRASTVDPMQALRYE